MNMSSSIQINYTNKNIFLKSKVFIDAIDKKKTVDSNKINHSCSTLM